MKQIQVERMFENLRFGVGNVIARTDDYILVKPRNSWDTNYEFHDLNEETVYLIDCGDVQYTVEDVEENGGIYIGDLESFFDVELIKEVAWRTIPATKVFN